MIPHWLHLVSIFALVLGFAAAELIMIDEMTHPQHMWIMNVVWPVVELFGTVLTTFGLFPIWTACNHGGHHERERREPSGENVTPFPVMVGNATLHCGSGCTLGDICAEWLAFTFPSIAGWLGWHWLFSEQLPSGCSASSSL